MKNLTLGLVFVGVICVVLGAVSTIVLSPYFEAKAFNDCTGGQATYFTALFTELRVETCK